MKFKINKKFLVLALSWSVFINVLGTCIGVFSGKIIFNFSEFLDVKLWLNFLFMCTWLCAALYWVILSSSKNID